MIRSLEQRLVVFLLLPVALLLLLTGLMGFLYARDIMLREWREAAILKLERAAHHLDMRLSRPIQWIHTFHKSAGKEGGAIAQQWVLEQFHSVEGVTGAELQWLHNRSEAPLAAMPRHGRGMEHGMRFHEGRISEVTSPQIDPRSGEKTIDLISDLRDEQGEAVGKLRVSLSFDYLMQDILRLGWWQSDQACLVDGSGHYLAHTRDMGERHHLAEAGDAVEGAILDAMKARPYGTVIGPGHPPKMVAGFYKIAEAPWTIIMFAPGDKILSPIIRFQIYYLLAGLACVALILLIIRRIGGGMVQAIKELSLAADRITAGSYGEPLQARSSDEMGRLVESFNKMVEGLKERDFISNTFGRYVDQEIAKEILSKPDAGRLGGEKRLVAILMSDIRGFTPMSDSLKPEGTIKILNRYFSGMIELVRKHKGIIVDFFGDGLLVFFDPLEGDALPVLRNAVRCALDMQSSMEGLNLALRSEGLPALQMGVGVNAGEVVVGNIGSESRAKYGIVGSPVNMTQRIQAEAKGGEVVISDAVLSPLAGEVRVNRSFTSRLKGIEGELKLFIVDGISPAPSPLQPGSPPSPYV